MILDPLPKTGNDLIDEQHRRLLEITRELKLQLESADADRTIGVILQRLRDHAAEHFAFEEELLERSGYPRLMLHRATHYLLQVRLNQLYDRWSRGEADVRSDLYEFLFSDWLVEHLLSEDMRYVPYLKD